MCASSFPRAAPVAAGLPRLASGYSAITAPEDALTAAVRAALASERSGRSVGTATASTPLTLDMLFRHLGLILNPSIAARFPSNEHLLAVSPDGTILNGPEGTDAGVVLGASFDAPLRRAGAGIILVHNHPRGNGLSAADLGQLSKPGVGGIFAAGHDGSLYAASAGPAHDGKWFESRIYPWAKTQVIRQLRIETPGARVDMSDFDPHVEHLMAMALDKAKVIRYRAALASSRKEFCRRFAQVIRHVTESVGSRLRLELGKVGSSGRTRSLSRLDPAVERQRCSTFQAPVCPCRPGLARFWDRA